MHHTNHLFFITAVVSFTAACSGAIERKRTNGAGNDYYYCDDDQKKSSLLAEDNENEHWPNVSCYDLGYSFEDPDDVESGTDDGSLYACEYTGMEEGGTHLPPTDCPGACGKWGSGSADCDGASGEGGGGSDECGSFSDQTEYYGDIQLDTFCWEAGMYRACGLTTEADQVCSVLSSMMEYSSGSLGDCPYC